MAENIINSIAEQAGVVAGMAKEQASVMAAQAQVVAAEQVAKVAGTVAAAAGQYVEQAAIRGSGQQNVSINAWDKVKAARAKGRPTARMYIDKLFTEFTEMHGDRRFADDAAIIGGIAFFEGSPVTVMGIEKGTDTKDRVRRNFGSPNPEGYRKALRLMKQAEKFDRPVVCIVDTAGAFCGIGAEERGQGQAIAENLTEMAALKVPIISLFIGEGGSGGALALALADEVWMMENAIYSVISPEGCASILWKDAKKVKEAAECMRLTAADMTKYQIVDRVFEEKSQDISHSIDEIKQALAGAIASYGQMDPAIRCQKRYDRFRKFGALQ
jgi:acetyl-CoA carboxylase carboxyl transferase subunit alpha